MQQCSVGRSGGGPTGRDVAVALAAIEAHGGTSVMPLTPQKAVEAIATFRDPAGNVLGVFHEGGG